MLPCVVFGKTSFYHSLPGLSFQPCDLQKRIPAAKSLCAMFPGPVPVQSPGSPGQPLKLLLAAYSPADLKTWFLTRATKRSVIYEKIWWQWFVIITAIPSPDGSPDEMDKNWILFVAGDRCRLGPSSGISSDTQHTAGSGASHKHVCVVAVLKTVKWIIGLLSGVFRRFPFTHPLKSCISQVLCLQATEMISG